MVESTQFESLENRALLASVEGYIFKDMFRRDYDGPGLHLFPNGLRDSVQPGQPLKDIGVVFRKDGVFTTPTVRLFDAGPNQRIGGGDDQLLASQLADNSGFYRFENLAAGFYIIRFDNIPEGFRFQARDLEFDDPNDPPENHIDSDVDGKGRSRAFQLGADTAGEQSAAIVSNKQPGNIVAVFNGFHAQGPNGDNGINFGNLVTGQNATRTVRWYNTGGRPITIRRADGGVARESVDTGPVTGSFWEFVTDLTGVTVQPGRFINVTIRYGTDVPGNFGDPGSFVVGSQTLDGPINVTAQAVNGIGATIRGKLKAPRRNDATYTFKTYYASDPNDIDRATIDGEDVEIVNGAIGFRQRARLDGPCTKKLDVAAFNCEVTLQIDAPGGQWNTADNGTYQIRHLRRAVRNDDNVFVAGRLLRTFRVRFPEPRSDEARERSDEALIEHSQAFLGTINQSKSAPSPFHGQEDDDTLIGSNENDTLI